MPQNISLTGLMFQMGCQTHGDYQEIPWTTRSRGRREIRLWWAPGSSARFGPHTIFPGSGHQEQDPPIWPTLPCGSNFSVRQLVPALLTLPDALPCPLYTQMLVQSPPPHPPIQGIPGGISEKGKLRRNISGVTSTEGLLWPSTFSTSRKWPSSNH